jgi:hypothetical protein
MTTLAECGITPAAESFLRQMDDVDRYLKAGLRPLTAMCAALDQDAELLVYAAAKRMAADIKASADNIRSNMGLTLPNGDPA